MRHRDKETAAAALEDWKRTRAKVTTEGGENYEKPVLVNFLDAGTFEVMDRDIVEDEFYVLRKYRIVRELKADGSDLEAAIRDARNRTAPDRGRGGRVPRGRKPEGEGAAKKGQKRGGRRRRPRRPRGGGSGGTRP